MVMLVTKNECRFARVEFSVTFAMVWAKYNLHKPQVNKNQKQRSNKASNLVGTFCKLRFRAVGINPWLLIQ